MAENKSRRMTLAAWAAVVLILALSAWFLRGPVLRAICCLLIVDQPREGVTHICLRGDEYGGDGNGYFDKAAQRYQADPSLGILVIEPKSSRLVQTGILPSFVAISRRELTARGVPETAILIIPGEAPNKWHEARHLGDWVRKHPEAQVQLLCDRFHSRYLRTILDTILEPPIAARVRLTAIPDYRFDENNWWQSRSGRKAFLLEFLTLCHTKIQGESDETE